MVFGLSNDTIAALVGLERANGLTVEQPALPFGGFTGDKALVRLTAPDGTVCKVILKRTSLSWANKEVNAYRALKAAGAPVVACYGMHVLDDDRAVVAVEYLPVASAWPILPDTHLRWSEALALLAKCRIPASVTLPEIHYTPERDAILSGIEEALAFSDPELQVALSPLDTIRFRDRVRAVLKGFLAAVDALPRGLTHGEAYSMHVGRRTPDGPVLLFDVTSAAIRPRFFDVEALIVDHGEPYEIGDVTPVLRRFREVYESNLSWDVFRCEVAMIEGLIALRGIGQQAQLMRRGIEEAWQNEREAHLGHVKWIRLSILKADEALAEWERSVAGGPLV
ncbi:MAG: hypothetical protein A3F84_00095 [Candidatus Handelsmanbacteria bacterium RIFCSPLOWO2_12_FULL_64_10]|uniref:Aminoglycoside phosphotransferase domain-containing protein n=1 Tax=Handelsmanbacteria sp. (strain RIFCSPLOWO2_12_FULL_64_10) TaxID=1817868 RepID=A0A1F6CP07_HANXR|nr:MAG: hypothetical protein A3F84_00095 [Candidatus Handelsmanbacteria bacterium RIFCSPLOWO2_12_FULL_64_10]